MYLSVIRERLVSVSPVMNADTRPEYSFNMYSEHLPTMTNESPDDASLQGMEYGFDKASMRRIGERTGDITPAELHLLLTAYTTALFEPVTHLY